ncbi:MAG TPA: DNA adenine methylase [Mycobacteriales bacterium]|nr:DNA adenine methylase [Mycobacteriales bacterium]
MNGFDDQAEDDVTVEADVLPLGDLVTAPSRRSAALRYPGSKWSIAAEIIGQFQDHYHYVEPYFGSGAVFFTKPVSPHELINDLNALVINFFRVLRDRTDELVFALEATPWSRDEYDQSHVLTGDELEDARRFVTRIWQAHASDLAKKTGWKNRGSKQPARGMSVRWQRVPSELADLAHRLRDAEIENRPAIEVITRFATADTLIYADPPYLMEARTQAMYAHEMSVDEHVAMLDALVAHPGPVVISGYENSIYDAKLPGWNKVLVKPPKVEKQAVRTEVLWVKPGR